MLSYNELKPGIFIVLDGQPFAVLESEFLRMQQRKPVMKTKIKNLISGSVVERAFQPSDQVEEAEMEKLQAKFLYSHRGELWFCEANDAKNRFQLEAGIIAGKENFLKPNLEIEALKFNGKILSIELPVKIDYKVVEAPPGIKGDTAQGGTKTVTIETGAKINTPLFINEGDIIRVNTESGSYVERVEKA
ncbi:MAG: elongation factor P [Spirochaetia bacterium]|nr:MAG: elongation factor P [Spirochaetia bacterium]